MAITPILWRLVSLRSHHLFQSFWTWIDGRADNNNKRVVHFTLTGVLCGRCLTAPNEHDLVENRTTEQQSRRFRSVGFLATTHARKDTKDRKPCWKAYGLFYRYSHREKRYH